MLKPQLTALKMPPVLIRQHDLVSIDLQDQQ